MCDSIFPEFIWCNFVVVVVWLRGKNEHRTTYKLNHIHFIEWMYEREHTKATKQADEKKEKTKKKKRQKNVNKKLEKTNKQTNEQRRMNMNIECVCRPQSDAPTRNLHIIVGGYLCECPHRNTIRRARARARLWTPNGRTQEKKKVNRGENMERQKIIIKQISIEKLCIKW